MFAIVSLYNFYHEVPTLILFFLKYVDPYCFRKEKERKKKRNIKKLLSRELDSQSICTTKSSSKSRNKTISKESS